MPQQQQQILTTTDDDDDDDDDDWPVEVAAVAVRFVSPTQLPSASRPRARKSIEVEK
jgi:hypothetical protein